MMKLEYFSHNKKQPRKTYDLAKLYATIEKEDQPDITISEDEYLKKIKIHSKFRSSLRWIAFAENRIVGCVHLSFKLLSENTSSGRIEISLLKSHQTYNNYRFLLHSILQEAISIGRSKMTCTVLDGSKFAEYLESLGLSKKDTVIENHLNLSTLNEYTITEKLRKYPSLNENFKLVSWNNLCPDHLLQKVSLAKSWLTYNPHGQRRVEKWNLTEDWIREEERIRRDQGISWITMIAIEGNTSKISGLSDVFFSKFRPLVANQEDTVIAPENRDIGLATYIKLNLLLQLIRKKPNIQTVLTLNSQTNIPIIKINNSIGFTKKRTFGKWEFEADKLISLLE